MLYSFVTFIDSFIDSFLKHFFLPITALEKTVETLEEATAYFSRLDCSERLRKVYYLQARLHHALGHTTQHNKFAMLFRLLDQELPLSGVTVMTHI